MVQLFYFKSFSNFSNLINTVDKLALDYGQKYFLNLKTVYSRLRHITGGKLISIMRISLGLDGGPKSIGVQTKAARDGVFFVKKGYLLAEVTNRQIVKSSGSSSSSRYKTFNYSFH